MGEAQQRARNNAYSNTTYGRKHKQFLALTSLSFSRTLTEECVSCARASKGQKKRQKPKTRTIHQVRRRRGYDVVRRQLETLVGYWTLIRVSAFNGSSISSSVNIDENQSTVPSLLPSDTSGHSTLDVELHNTQFTPPTPTRFNGRVASRRCEHEFATRL